jgi:hypothetical protein
MSLQRLKRLQRLESRRPAEKPYVDRPEAVALLRWYIASAEAVRAGKASLVPRYGPPREPSPAKHEALRALDRVAARLAA